jgi:hypothetical protein
MSVTPMRHPKVTSAIGKLNEARNLAREAARELTDAKSQEATEAHRLADQISQFAKRLW